MNSGFQAPEGADANLGGPEWPSTLYVRTFSYNYTPAPSILQFSRAPISKALDWVLAGTRRP